MAVTVAELATNLRISQPDADQLAILGRVLGAAQAHTDLPIPNAPVEIAEMVQIRFATYLYEQPLGIRDSFANGWINSGAGSLAGLWQPQGIRGSEEATPGGVPTTGGLDSGQVSAIVNTILAVHAAIVAAHHEPWTGGGGDGLDQIARDAASTALVAAETAQTTADASGTAAAAAQTAADANTTTATAHADDANAHHTPPTGGEGGGSGEDNVQADWNEVDDQSDAYIQNKPAIPDLGNLAEQVDHLIDELLHESTTEAVTGVLGNSLTSLRYSLPAALAEITNVSVRVHLSVQRNSFVQWDTNERVRLTVEGGGALATLIPETHYNLGQNYTPNFHFVLNKAELTTGAKTITFTAEVVNAPSVEVHFISVTDLTYSSLTLRELPPDGDTGQILAKASPTSYDTEWIDNADGGGGQGTTLNHFRAPLTVQATAGLTTAAVNRTLITAAAIRENLGFTLNVAGDTLTFVNAGRYMVNVVEAFVGTGSSRDTVKLNLLPAVDFGMLVGAAYYRGSPGALTGCISGAAIVNVAAGDTLQLGAFTETDTTNTYAFGGVDSHIEIQELPLTG